VRIGVEDHDNLETLRLKKYATGAHLLLEEDPGRLDVEGDPDALSRVGEIFSLPPA
jgi:hypothetical protein